MVVYVQIIVQISETKTTINTQYKVKINLHFIFEKSYAWCEREERRRRRKVIAWKEHIECNIYIFWIHCHLLAHWNIFPFVRI